MKIYSPTKFAFTGCIAIHKQTLHLVRSLKSLASNLLPA